MDRNGNGHSRADGAFEFHLHDVCVVRRARVIHCAWMDGDCWNVGAAFQPAAGEPTIEQLIDRIG